MTPGRAFPLPLKPIYFKNFSEYQPYNHTQILPYAFHNPSRTIVLITLSTLFEFQNICL